jgi:PTS system nitrogen regulatory IIA component
MRIADLLTPERIVFEVNVSSKKRAMEVLSKQLASATTELTTADVLNRLIARERLGSTGFGHGVAIPHSRMDNIENAIGAVLKLQQGIDFDAADQQPVDFLFALLVPEASTEEHLELLSQLAEMFSEETIRTQLRTAKNAKELIQIFDKQAASRAA